MSPVDWLLYHAEVAVTRIVQVLVSDIYKLLQHETRRSHFMLNLLLVMTYFLQQISSNDCLHSFNP